MDAKVSELMDRRDAHKADGNRVAAIQCGNRVLDRLDAIRAETLRHTLRGIDFRTVSAVEGDRGTSPVIHFKDTTRESVTIKAYPGDDIATKCRVWLGMGDR